MKYGNLPNYRNITDGYSLIYIKLKLPCRITTENFSPIDNRFQNFLSGPCISQG